MMNHFRINNEKVLFAAVFTMAALIFILRMILATSYLPETGGVSINVLYGILRILHGNYLYTDPEQPPFPIIQYMPLHFYIIKNLAVAAGIQENVHGVMVMNRMFCLAIDCISVGILQRSLMKNFSFNFYFSAILSLIYFVCIPGIIFGRGDNLYLLFFIITATTLMKSYSPGNNASVHPRYLPHIVGMTSSLAVCTKQTGVFLVVLCCIYFLFRKDLLKNLIIYSLVFITCSGIIFLITQPYQSLWEFKLNVVDGVKNGINANWFMEVFLKNFFLKFSYLLAAGLVIAVLLLRSGKEWHYRFAGVAILWYFLAALLSSFKAGSGPNYYLEFIVLSIFGLALLIHGKNIAYRNYLLPALVLSPFFLFASANDKGWGDTRQLKKAKNDYMQSKMVAEYILPRLQKNEWVLSNFHKESCINLHLNDKALFPCREVALYFTRPIGVFQFSAFSRMINTEAIPYIVDRKNEFPELFLEDSLIAYEADTVIGNYSIYKRKP